MPYVKLESIGKSFSNIKALDTVDLEVELGDFFTLLGPSGCGKSTLLRIIAGLERQDRGHIYLEGRKLDGIPPHKRETAMVFQDFAIFPHMTVFENVAFGLRSRNINSLIIKDRVTKALEMVRLETLKDRTPDQLSGGQQQRVALARSIVIEPKILLMDEPLSNLDARLRVEMRERIRDIQQDLGITTIYVTHDQEEAMVISDRICVMNNGAIEQIGKAWEIYKSPASKFVASFVGNINLMEGKMRPSMDERFMAVKVGGTELRINKPEKERDEAILAIRPEDITLIGSDQRKKDTFNYLSGRIRKISFTGSVVQCLVECNDGIELFFDIYRPEQEVLEPVDKMVEIKFPFDAVLIFDADTGEKLEYTESW